MVWGIIICAGLLIAAGWHFSNTVLYVNVATPEQMREAELEHGRFDAATFDQWVQESITIPSPHGYQLFGLYFPRADANTTVIIVHGIGCNHYCSVKYAEIFRQRGFNLLLVDLRYHGNSGGDNISFGYYEKYDIQAWVDWVIARCEQTQPDKICRVGTHGESLGAATVLQHAAIDSRLNFVIADCAYANLVDEVAYRFKVERHMPCFPLVPITSGITKLRAGFAFGDAAPIKTMAQVKTPVLFIHGQADDYTPPAASIALHAAKPEPKMLYLVPDAGHARALVHDPDKYAQVVAAFLAGIEVEE